MAHTFTIKFDDEQTSTVLVPIIKDNIQELGKELGIDKKLIDECVQLNNKAPPGQYPGTLKMLNAWRKDEAGDQFPTLWNALDNAGMHKEKEDIMSKLQFSQDQIVAFANEIGDNSNFIPLCTKLGFTTDEAKAYQKENKPDQGSFMGTVHMLNDWQEEKQPHNQIPTLKAALQQSGMSDIAVVL